MTLSRGWLVRQFNRVDRDIKQLPPFLRPEDQRNITSTKHMRDAVESILDEMEEKGEIQEYKKELLAIANLIRKRVGR